METIYRSPETHITCRECGGRETYDGDRPVCVHDRYVRIGEGVSSAPAGSGFVHFGVYQLAHSTAWWMANPTNPRGRDVRYEGEVRNVRAIA